MDLSTVVFEAVVGFTPRKAIRFFLARIWVGYVFDAGEFAFTWIHVGMLWKSDLWKYIFYGYVGFLGLIALTVTVLMIVFVLRGHESDGRLKMYKKIPYLMGYFKLTCAVNAGIVFFMNFFSDKKNEPVVLALEIVAGIDMGIDLIQMAFGFSGFNLQRVCAKETMQRYDDTHNNPNTSPIKSVITTSPRKYRK